MDAARSAGRIGVYLSDRWVDFCVLCGDLGSDRDAVAIESYTRNFQRSHIAVVAILSVYTAIKALKWPNNLIKRKHISSVSIFTGKRFCEPRSVRRSWETWWYDTSKQGIGALAIHMTNVVAAPMYTGDPCTWYVINFLLDSTIGLLIIFVGIRVCHYLARRNKWPAIHMGEYGELSLRQRERPSNAYLILTTRNLTVFAPFP